MAQKHPRQRQSSPAPSGHPSVQTTNEPAAAAPAPQGPSRWDAAIRRSEFALCMEMTIFIVVCHFVFLRHRGGLWRDEIQIVNLGLSPSLADFWKDLVVDTFPALWPAVVRCWTWIGGESDGALRVLGLLVGLSIVASLWWTSWRVGRGFPLLGLALFALCPTVIRYGDTVRGYGLGLVCLLLMYAAIWRVAIEPTARNVAIGLVAALLAVQSMYFNAVVLLALGAASAAISLRRRTWKPVLAVTGIGLAAAISLLPYADPLSRQAEWHDILSYTVSFSKIAATCIESVNASGGFSIWVWSATTVAVVAAVFYAATRHFGRLAGGDYDGGIFAAVMIVAGILAYLVFVFATKHPTNVWYYMPLLAFLAVSFDAVFETGLMAHRTGWIARLVAAAVVFLLTIPAAWNGAHVRMTNVDLIAEVLQKKAGKEDLIVIGPWWLGVAFNRYYHGESAWMTVPDMGSMRLQRYAVLKQRMAEKDAIRPLRERIAATLHGGRHVWLVGWLSVMPPDGMPHDPPPPIPEGPMNEEPYMYAWGEQMTYDLQHNSSSHAFIPVDAHGPVSEAENAKLLWCEGGQ